VLLAPVSDQMHGWPLFSWLPARAWDLLPSTDSSATGIAAGTLPAPGHGRTLLLPQAHGGPVGHFLLPIQVPLDGNPVLMHY